MTKLEWDQLGTRLYETGLDRGVLYLPTGKGVAWNGLTTVDEDLGSETTEQLYFDGVKYLDIPVVGDFAASLGAITFPDEFLEIEGMGSLSPGLYIDDQIPKRFGLSYRTLVGNDVEGQDFAYQIHVVYNLIAVPDQKTQTTHSSSVNVSEFGWTLSSTPEIVPGFRPTAHLILDSRYLSGERLEALETVLYGSPKNDANLPTMARLAEIVSSLNTITIVDHGDGTWSATGPDDQITMLNETTFQITGAAATYLDSDTYEISSS